MERRVCRRAKADREVVLLQGSRLYRGQMTNRSDRGIRVSARVRLDAGSAVGVHMTGEIMMTGHIRWVRKVSGRYDIGFMLERE